MPPRTLDRRKLIPLRDAIDRAEAAGWTQADLFGAIRRFAIDFYELRDGEMIKADPEVLGDPAARFGLLMPGLSGPSPTRWLWRPHLDRWLSDGRPRPPPPKPQGKRAAALAQEEAAAKWLREDLADRPKGSRAGLRGALE